MPNTFRPILATLALILALSTTHANADTPTPLASTPSTSPSPIPMGEGAGGEGSSTVTAIDVATCPTPPKIDGDLGDTCWQTATHADTFYRYRGTAPITQQTQAWLCADPHRLYVAFHCQDSQPDQIRTAETLRNGNLYNDDNVSVQIDSQNTRHDTSTFQVSARGTQSESIEGGTADNITWAGDWVASVKRVPDGWNAEIAIPWALLRYHRGAHAMGIFLTRKLARETSSECWPYMTRDQQTNTIQNLTTFTGLAPADYKPRPIFLPYALVTGGEGYNARYGIDAKYPITTTMTGLATINPDFQDVAQAIQSINFSYDQRQYPDSRPFFAEGGDFMPYSDVFYSRAIGDIDEGVKMVGKQGPDRIAALVTGDHENGGRGDQVFSIYHEIGQLNYLHLSAAQDQQAGTPSSLAAKFEGQVGWQTGQTRYSITANHEPTWSGGRQADSRDYIGLNAHTPRGKPYYAFNWIDTGPNFVNNIGFIPESNIRSANWTIGQSNTFDTGKIWDYGIELAGDHTDYHTGGFFHDSANIGTWLDWQNGTGIYFNALIRRRNQGPGTSNFRDHVNETAYYWNERGLYTQGSIDNRWGTQAGQHYDFLSANQGYALSKTLTSSINYNRQYFGGQITTQTILSGTYRLTYERSIGIRAVSIDHDTNLFLSYAQKARRGSDIYFLIGDPNSQRTRGLITLKVVTPI